LLAVQFKKLFSCRISFTAKGGNLKVEKGYYDSKRNNINEGTADIIISGKLTAEMFEGNETQFCRSNGYY
jgi:ketol-acid reductoisomerase